MQLCHLEFSALPGIELQLMQLPEIHISQTDPQSNEEHKPSLENADRGTTSVVFTMFFLIGKLLFLRLRKNYFYKQAFSSEEALQTVNGCLVLVYLLE